MGHWWQENGIEVIPNVRTADDRTFSFCFDGIEKNSTVAVGTHGCIKRKEDRDYFKRGLDELVKRLSPRTIIVYGSAPDDIFGKYNSTGIRIVQFSSEYSMAHSEKEVPEDGNR